MDLWQLCHGEFSLYLLINYLCRPRTIIDGDLVSLGHCYYWIYRSKTIAAGFPVGSFGNDGNGVRSLKFYNDRLPIAYQPSCRTFTLLQPLHSAYFRRSFTPMVLRQFHRFLRSLSYCSAGPYLFCFPHESFNETVRLKTGLSRELS